MLINMKYYVVIFRVRVMGITHWDLNMYVISVHLYRCYFKQGEVKL